MTPVTTAVAGSILVMLMIASIVAWFAIYRAPLEPKASPLIRDNLSRDTNETISQRGFANDKSLPTQQPEFERRIKSAERTADRGLLFGQLALALMAFALFAMAYQNHEQRSKKEFELNADNHHWMWTVILGQLGLGVALLAGFVLPAMIS